MNQTSAQDRLRAQIAAARQASAMQRCRLQRMTAPNLAPSSRPHILTTQSLNFSFFIAKVLVDEATGAGGTAGGAASTRCLSNIAETGSES